MTNNIQTILTPLLIFSYISGLRIVEFSTSRLKARFSLLYILLLWTIFFFFLIYIIPYIIKFNIDFFIFFGLSTFISLMSVISGVYYNKKFKKCLQKIAFVDETLKQLGTTTDYQKFYIKTLWLTLGWFMMATLITCVEIVRLKYESGFNIIVVCSINLVTFYCLHLNLISDLIIATILGYIGLKFDQINDNLQKLTKECEIKPQTRKNNILHSRQRRQLKVFSNKYMTWIVMHLHSELHKISQEINSIFGMQMTIKMGLYFGLIGSFLRVIFSTIFIKSYINEKKVFFVVALFWEIVFAFQVILINCTCERVTIKANAIGSYINRISSSTYDDEIRENISQLLLQMIQSPLKFCGIGLFQFGFKFLYGFSTSIVSVVIIIVQAHASKQC